MSTPVVPERPTRKETRLTRGYFYFCVFETVFINVVGFLTLVFQNELATLIHPGRAATYTEQNTYQFWINHDPLAFNNRKERCLSLMLAGWIFLAGMIQALVNLDTRVSAFVKIRLLYAFFACDVYWLVLMYAFPDVLHRNQIHGSILTILLRLMFILRGPSSCFIEEARQKEE